jgi:hypothetical protein
VIETGEAVEVVSKEERRGHAVLLFDTPTGRKFTS